MTFIEFWSNIEAKIPQKVYTFLQKVIYQKNTLIVDIWLFVHFIVGLVMGIFTRNPLLVLIVVIIFEIFENGYLYKNSLSQYESITNTLTDILATLIGWFIVRIAFFKGKISFKKF